MADIKQLKQNLSGGGGEVFYPITSLDAVKRNDDETSLKEILQTMQSNMGDAFSDSKSYAIGDYCIYQDVLYKFIATKSAGAWNADAVSATTVAAEMASFANQISVLNSQINLPFSNLGTSSILAWAKSQEIGNIYVMYTQNALDSPTKGNVSFTILNKPGEDYMYFYMFAYNHIYYASAMLSTESLNWSMLI